MQERRYELNFVSTLCGIEKKAAIPKKEPERFYNVLLKPVLNFVDCHYVYLSSLSSGEKRELTEAQEKKQLLKHVKLRYDYVRLICKAIFNCFAEI